MSDSEEPSNYRPFQISDQAPKWWVAHTEQDEMLELDTDLETFQRRLQSYLWWRGLVPPGRPLACEVDNTRIGEKAGSFIYVSPFGLITVMFALPDDGALAVGLMPLCHADDAVSFALAYGDAPEAWEHARELETEIATWFPHSGKRTRARSLLGKARDSGHFAFSKRRREEIVAHYRKERDAGLVADKDGWARTKHGISGRTLLNYENEFPEGGEN